MFFVHLIQLVLIIIIHGCPTYVISYICYESNKYILKFESSSIYSRVHSNANANTVYCFFNLEQRRRCIGSQYSHRTCDSRNNNCNPNHCLSRPSYRRRPSRGDRASIDSTTRAAHPSRRPPPREHENMTSR